MTLILDITIMKQYVAEGRKNYKDSFESISHCVHKEHQSYHNRQKGCILYCGISNAKYGYPILDDTSPLINNAYSIANDFIITYPINKL